MKIAYFLKKENNNLDLIRIILASIVILGHTIFINGDTKFWTDPVKCFFSFTYSGAIAVKLFFFISGLVVTNSYCRNDSHIYFVLSRFFRILPALLFLLLVTVFIIGPIFTNYSLIKYFSNQHHYSYIWKNILFLTEYTLPGLFTENLYPKVINGSLWSLGYEIKCYLFLMFGFIIFKKRGKLIFNLLFVAIIIDTLLPSGFIMNHLGSNPEILYLPLAFSYGAFFALNQNKIVVNLFIVILSFLILLILLGTRFEEYIFVIASCNLIVFLSSRKFILKLKPKYDISYGIYLWGFLIQQVVYFLLGHIYAGYHFILSLIISMVIAYFSFVYLERPFIDFGKRTYQFYKSKFLFLS